MKKTNQNLFEEFPPVSTDEWLEKVKKDLKGKAIESLNWELEEGISLKPFYRKEDVKEIEATLDILTNSGWQISENFNVEEGVTGTKKINAKLKEALKSGIEAPVFNIDHVLDKKDFSVLLKGIHQEMINIGFSGLFPEADPIGFLKLIAGETGKANKHPKAFNGNLQLDPIGFFIENGEFYESLEADINSLEKAIVFIDRKLPSYKLLQVDMHLMPQQGSDISRELAVALATGSEYLAQLTNLGLNVDQVHPKMAFSLSVGNLYFPQIAKIRALKALWIKVLEGYGSVRLATPVVKAATSQSAQTEDQYINMIQSTTSAMAAILGGADFLTVTPSNQAHGKPDEFSNRIARNIQHILREESHFGKVENPVAGSYYLEVLTKELMDKAWKKFQKIEAAGGILEYLG